MENSTDKEKLCIKELIYAEYEKNGLISACDWTTRFNKFNVEIPFYWCEPCDHHTPSINNECCCCGSDSVIPSMENIRLVNINTTAFSEEDLSIVTNLTDEEIIEVIVPLVLGERNEESEYDNDTLFKALVEAYPTKFIQIVVEAVAISI